METGAPDFADVDQFVQGQQKDSFGDIDDFVAKQAKGAPAPSSKLLPEVENAIHGVPRPATDMRELSPIYEHPADPLSQETVKPPQSGSPAAGGAERAVKSPEWQDILGTAFGAVTNPEPTAETGIPSLGPELTQGVKELGTPGKRGTGALRTAAAGLEATTPLMGPAVLENPASIAKGLIEGTVASKAGGYVAKKAGASDEQKSLIEDLAFWAPGVARSFAATLGLADPKVGVQTGPEGTGVGIQGSGGTSAGVAVTPEEIRIGGKFRGGPQRSVSIPRGAKPGPAGIEPPTVEGQVAQPPNPMEEAASSMAAKTASEADAARAVAGVPPPPPPPPPTPPPVHEVSQEEVAKAGHAISALPPELRAPAMIEAHGTLSKLLTEQGKIVMPDGQLQIVKTPQDGEKLAQTILNDEVARQDKVAADAAKVDNKPAKVVKEPAKVANAAPENIVSQAAGLREKAPDFSDVDKFVAKAVKSTGEQRDTPNAVVAEPAAGGIHGDTENATGPTTGRGTFTKGDRVELADGTKAQVIFTHPSQSIVRVKTDDGKKISVGISKVKAAGIPSAAATSKLDSAERPPNNPAGGTKGKIPEETGNARSAAATKPENDDELKAGNRGGVEAPAARPTGQGGEDLAGSVPPNAPTVQGGDHKKSNEPAETVEPKYKHGSTQANIPDDSEAAKALETARQRISKEDVAGKGTDVGGNHLTVRYGIKGDDHAGIKKYLSSLSPFEAKLGKTEKFPPSEHSDGAAVIHAPIEAPELHTINKEIEKHGEFAEPSFGAYKPHATVAYVKPEKADRYVGMSATEGKKFPVNSIAITDRQGNQEEVKLEGKKAEPLIKGRKDLAPPEGEEKGTPEVEAHKALYRSLHSQSGAAERWEKLRTNGATDEKLKQQIGHEYGIQGGSLDYSYKGGENPKFYYAGGISAGAYGKPTLQGKALVDKVRDLMGIPQLRLHKPETTPQNAPGAAISKEAEAQPTPKAESVAPPVVAKEETTTKEPWEMTREGYGKQFKPVRNFQKYTSEDRAILQSSHRQGYLKKRSVGEYFYTHEHNPERGFDTAGLATDAAHKAVVEKAVKEGKPVPTEVLKDYPELAKPQAKESVQPAPKAEEKIEKVEAPPPEPTKAEQAFIGDVKKRAAALRETIKGLKHQTSAPAAYYQDSAKNASARLERSERIKQLSDAESELRDIEQEHKYDLAEKVEPETAVPEEGKNFEGRYLKAALEPSREAWKEKMAPEMYEKAAKGKLNATLTPPKGKEKLLVKVPDDGTFLIPNTPVAIEHAIKGADKFSFTQDKPAPTGAQRKLRVPGSPREFDTEKYIVGLEKEVADLQDQIGKANALQKPHLEEELKAANENLAEAKKATPETLAQRLAGESGSFEPGKLVEPITEAYKQDVQPVLEKAGVSLKDTAAWFVSAIYPRVEESSFLGRKLGVAAPTDAVDALMKLKGDRARAMSEFDGIMHGLEKMFDRLPDEQRVDFIDRLQSGSQQPTSELREIAGAIKSIQAAERAEEQAAANLGRKSAVKLPEKENYFHNRWETPPGKGKAEDEDTRISRLFTPKRPLEGSKAYNKQQSYTLKSGIAAGGKPVTTNPIRLLRLRLEDGMKFVTARRAWHELGELDLRQYVPMGEHDPEGFERVDDRIAKVYFPAELASGKTAVIEGGHWAVEANTARLLNNMLSRDLIRANPVGRGLMWLKNASTALELGLSPFHAVFETIEAASSQLALGMLRSYNLGIREGDAHEFATGLRQILEAPVAPITMAREGSALPAYIEARARLNKIGISEFGHKQIEGKQPHGIMEGIEHFREVRKQAGIQRLLKTYPDLDQLVDDMFTGGMIIGQHADYQTKMLGKTAMESWSAGNPIGALVRAVPTITQGVMKPLFQWYIPNLKYSLFLRQMSEQAAENSKAIEDGTMTRAELARRVVDSVENRFGELNFDNLFWNRTFKTALQFAFRSVTWKLGNVRELGGAVAGQSKELGAWAWQAHGLLGDGKTPVDDTVKPGALPKLDMKASWLMALIMTTVGLGAVAAKVLSKKYPWEWAKEEHAEEGDAAFVHALYLETIHPRTGDSDSRDKPVRISLPTYWKDVEGATSNPAQYVMGSLSSTLGKGIDLAHNEDYFGNYIYPPSETATLGTKLKDAAKYMAPTPFVVSSYQRNEASAGKKTAILSAFGFPKAPSNLDFTPAEKKAVDLLKIRQPRHTQEQLADWQAKREALDRGEMTPKEAKAYIREQRLTWFEREVKHLSYGEALQVLDKANPEEEQILLRAIHTKRANLLKQHKQAQVEKADEEGAQ